MQKVFTKRMLIVLFLGFSSGLPFLLTRGTLQLWLKSQGLSLPKIGLFAVLGIAFNLKFLWAPLMDRYALTRFGRRKSWLLVTQLALLVGICVLGQLTLSDAPTLFVALVFAINFFSASQDIVIDAYTREILPDDEQGLGASLKVFAYRIAMLTSGAFALYLSDVTTWKFVYLAMGFLVLVGIVTTLLADEPKVEMAPRTLQETFIGPLKNFISRKDWIAIVAFVLLYKLGEVFATGLSNPFYSELGFSNTEIGSVAKVVGIWAAIGGGLAGGALMLRLGLFRSLFTFGVLQSLGLLGFAALSQAGHNLWALGAAIGAENFTSGMATSAFVAYIAQQCERRYTATQYALLSSVAFLSSNFVTAPAGVMVNAIGWSTFFIVCFFVTWPGLFLLYKVRPGLNISYESDPA